VNGIPFHYMDEPVRVKRNELVRIYLVNILEYDPINSFHLHGNSARHRRRRRRDPAGDRPNPAGRARKDRCQARPDGDRRRRWWPTHHVLDRVARADMRSRAGQPYVRRPACTGAPGAALPSQAADMFDRRTALSGACLLAMPHESAGLV
jgi:hypothetical protein